METLKKILSFYINSSFHVAISIVALIKLTFLKFDIIGLDTYVYFSFFSAIVGYNFVKYANVAQLYHKRLTNAMLGIKIVTILSSFATIYFGAVLAEGILLLLCPFLILTILYAVPVFPNKKNLRSIAGIKIFIIAAVWTGITVIVPLLHVFKGFDTDMVIEAVQRFLFVVIIMLPFEIRDLEFDAGELATIPQKIGVTRTKVFGSILLLLFLILMVFKDDLSSVEIISMLVVTIVSLSFLWGTRKKQSEFFCSFWVESIPILWFCVFVLLHTLFG